MLYTKKGDDGNTTIFGCNQSISKSSAVAEALGALDETNTYLGLCRVHLQSKKQINISIGKSNRSLGKIVFNIQETLFSIQAEVAGADKKVSKTKVTNIEKIINNIEKEIPPIHTFKLSGGSVISSHLDIARTIARRAERRVVAVHEEGLQKVGKNTLAYLNRLSSLLFALARYVNYVMDIHEDSPKYLS